MSAVVCDLYRYPVKGLNPEKLFEVHIEAGKIFPCDRRFAIAQTLAPEEQPSREWRSKKHFVVLAKCAKLAKLECLYNEDNQMVSIFHRGQQVSQGKASTPIGRMLIDQFLDSFLAGDIVGKPRLVEANGSNFTDISEQQVSLINLNSVRDLEGIEQNSIDPLRFRGNIYIKDLPAWEERQWVGKAIKIGDVVFRVEGNTKRCKATNVNLETAEYDLNIPLALKRAYNHTEMGVYMTALNDGALRPEAPVTVG